MSLAAQLTALIGATEPTFRGPTIDYHALAPEIVLSAAIVVLVLLDSIKLERAKAFMPVVANLALLGALIPLLTLAYDGGTRILFGGSYVVGPMPLLLKAMFIVSTYVVVLLSMNYVAEGDYWESEYYTLLLSSVLGMVVMASSRDLIGIFVALELLSIPAYMLASWRKSDVRSNEAGMKYYLMGVFASAVLLYGMSLVYGIGGSTKLFELGRAIAEAPDKGVPVVTLALLFVVVGFAFKVSAVPFHVWAPDTYEGAPTPVTAFLAVASKGAGFVALISVVFYAFLPKANIIQPLFFVLSVSFCMSRLRFRGRKTFMNIALILGMFPSIMAVIAIYFILKAFGLTEGGFVIIALILVYSAGSGAGFYVMKGYMDTIPTSLDEAALLDGCTRFQVFYKIIIPICKPMIVYQAIIGFLTPWLDFVMAKVICRTQSNYTVALGLWLMLQKEYIQNWFARFAAAAVVISVPIAILFIVMQRFYQESMSGSVKG